MPLMQTLKRVWAPVLAPELGLVLAPGLGLVHVHVHVLAPEPELVPELVKRHPQWSSCASA